MIKRKMADDYVNESVPLGIKIPYHRNDLDGYFAQNRSTLLRYKTNLMMLLLTNKGERPMMPTYGSTLREILFEQNTADAVDGLLEDSITEAVERWMPDVQIDTLEITHGSNDLITELDSMGNEVRRVVGNDTNEYTVNINLIFSIKEIPESEQDLQLTIGV